MRALAYFAVGALIAQSGVLWASQTELAPGFEIAAKVSSNVGVFHLYTWRLQRNGDAASAVIELILVTAEEKHTQARIQPVLQRGSAVSLYAPLLCPGAFVVTNGSFYTRNGDKSAPLGLVRSGGKTLSEISQRRSGGFLMIDSGKIRIVPRSASARALAATDAIESSPIIVLEGENDMRSDDGVRFDRVALGTTSNKQTVVIGAFGDNQDSITLFEFSALARAAVGATGDRLSNLLAMDGGPSAHIYLPSTRRLYGYRGGAYLPNAICMGPR